MMASHVVRMAGYNRWANGRVYAAAATLSDTEYRADRGAFFGSVHRTLNHLLVTDRIWLWRITGDGQAPDRLDAILHDDLPGLTAARGAADGRLLDLAAGLDEAALGADVAYRNMQGDPFTQPLESIFAHLFNHQAHHRGQVHGILTGLGREAPSLDLVLFLRHG